MLGERGHSIHWIHRTDEFRERGLSFRHHWQRRLCRHFERWPRGILYVPQGYVSGAALSDSMTFNNATFASLGVTPGTYVWTWGTGLANQNFTLHIGSVPDGGSTVSLLGCALLGLAALRRNWVAKVLVAQKTTIRRSNAYRASPIPVPETRSAFHPRGQRNAFRRRDVSL